MKRLVCSPVSGLRRALACGAAAALLCAAVLGGCASDAPSAASSSSASSAAATSLSSSSASATEATVDVTVTAPDDEGGTLFAGSIDVAADATVLDALEATGLDVDAQDSEYGMFVNAIGGVAGEGMKGWIYTVNGEQVQSSADKCTLADGDAVEWSYIDMSE